MGNPAVPAHAEDRWRTVYFAMRTESGRDTCLHQRNAAGRLVGEFESARSRQISTMQDIYGDSMARTSFTLVMLAIAGSMALTLGILGIYGVISYTVSQRTREIGIRLALGAQKSELKWMFVRSALVLTGIGVVLACVQPPRSRNR